MKEYSTGIFFKFNKIILRIVNLGTVGDKNGYKSQDGCRTIAPFLARPNLKDDD